MRLIFFCCLLLVVNCFSLAQQSKEEKLQQLKNRTDIKVTEVEKDIIRLEYPSGKVIYKNIGEYIPDTENRITYSPTFDSTIIDLTTIDTTLYYHKYSFWQEVPVHNWDFDYIRIGDVNNNGKAELYGSRKFFDSGYEPVTIYELNDSGSFDSIYQYGSEVRIRNIYDITENGQEEVHLTTPGSQGPLRQRFYSSPSDTALATELNFTFFPFETANQLNNQTLGDFDNDGKTDLIFSRFGTPSVYIYEYNPAINNFDSVYRFDQSDLGKGGFSVGDFDLDGKTDIVFGTVNGNIFVVENEGDNQYINSWQSTVETYNVYFHTATNDIDGNGKPEFWTMGDAFYGEDVITRITIFETNGDNSYHVVGRIDLAGVFSFYAGTIQAIDIDGDGIEEVAICIDENFLILKFNGSENHHTYEVYYIKQNELATEEVGSNYYGAIMYDLLNDGRMEILISMNHIIYQQNIARRMTRIYKPDSLTTVYNDDFLISKIYLHQNYPNPFNPTTTVRFHINQFKNVSIKVYNVLGKEIKTLLEKQLSPGSYTIDWEARDSNGQLLPSGVYLIRLTANNNACNYTHTIKALLLK